MDSNVEIFINLLEEGTPTLRAVQAADLGNSLYKLLPSSDYDPEVEVWEFAPGTVVFGRPITLEKQKKAILAIRRPESKADLLKAHPHAHVVEVYVILREKSGRVLKKTEAIDLKNGLFKLLPTLDYDPSKEIWEFSPGSVVRIVKEKDPRHGEISLAFDQIREDMMNDHYAQHVTNR